MILNSPYISGSLTVTGNITAQGGIVISGSIASSSFATTASNALALQGLGSASFAPAETFNTVSQSYAITSGSLSTRVTTNENNITTLTAASASFAVASGSMSSRVTLIEGQYATTGSNNFTKPQQISDVSNAISFTSTASLYTDGGLRVKGSSFISGTAYFNDVVVYGTSSIEYITSSQLAIGTNIITLNTDTPSIRFGGISVFDSGSNNLSTGSLFWDSEKDKWIYSNPSASTYDGGMLISGPRNSSGLGNEVGTTSCALMMGQGGDHITSSAIFSYGNATCFYGQSYISSSGAAYFPGTVGIGTENAVANLTVKENESCKAIVVYGRTSDNLARIDFFRADETCFAGRIQIDNGTTSNMSIRTQGALQLQTGGSTNRLTICNTGEATFGCTLRVNGGELTIYSGASVAFAGVSPGSSHVYFGTNTAGYGLSLQAGGGERLIIASTGAATFACSVGATGAFTSTGTTTATLGFVTTNTSASKTHRAYTDTSGNYIIYDATLDSNRLTISSAGAATFTCNVTALDFYARSNSDREFISIGQSTGNQKQLLIGSTYASNVFYIQGIQQNVGYNQNISLQAQGGNVGIGTSSPNANNRLSIFGSGGSVGMLLDGISTPSLQLYSLTNEAGIGTNSNESKPLTFKINMTYGVVNSGTEAMRITSGGLVKVGAGSSNLGSNTIFSAGTSGALGVVTVQSSGSGTVDTGISINQGSGGQTVLLLASRHTSDGTSTNSAVYMIKFYYNGNNAPATTLMAGENFISFGVSGTNTLTLTAGGSAVFQYTFIGNK